jgi:hypothetical protein
MQLSCYLFHFSDLKFEKNTGVNRKRKLKKGRQNNGKKKKKKKETKQLSTKYYTEN